MIERDHLTSKVITKTTPIPLDVGDYIVLYEQQNNTNRIIFEGEVERHSPKSGLLEFNTPDGTEDIGQGGFKNLVSKCDTLDLYRDNKQ
jgi:hypothetical protein